MFVLCGVCLSLGLLLVVLVVIFGILLFWGCVFLCLMWGLMWWFFGLWVGIGFSGLCCCMFLGLLCVWFGLLWLKV